MNISATGLILGLVGALLAYFGPSWFHRVGLYSTPDELPYRGFVVGLGWVLIIIGTGLQVLAMIGR